MQLEGAEQMTCNNNIETFGVQRFMGSNQDMHFYTGLPNYDVFISIYLFVKPLIPQINYRPDSNITPDCIPQRARALLPIDELFLVFMSLRLSLLEQDLAHRFIVSIATVSRVCTTWIAFLDMQLRPLITWPSRVDIQRHMPSQFKKKYPTTRVIIDSTELFTEVPSSLNVQSATYSSYKHHNTFKALVGISTSGTITFISDLYAGSVSDKELTRSSGLLDLLEPGDSVMADKGFDILYDLDGRLNIPPFASRHTQMSCNDVVKTRQIASLRIHVERAIRRIKQYRILGTLMPLSIVALADHIWGVCCALTMFKPPLVSDM